MNKICVKPALSIFQIINMSMGFLGIQMGFALQNSNASRILQAHGADTEYLSLFWLVAPITGMVVQPIVGYYSDRTWTRIGRRRPYILVGALLTGVALFLMPNTVFFTSLMPSLLIVAGILLLMDTSINLTMEPFRALIGDSLSSKQRSLGFSVQTILIGIGAVLGSSLPYLLTRYFGFSTTDLQNVIPDNIRYSFYIGAIVLVLTVLWTVFTTKEYSSYELGFDNKSVNTKGIKSFLYDLKHMPLIMKKLGWVQFYTWFAFFMMWVYMTPAIAEHVFYKMEGNLNQLYIEAGNWVGVLFGVYNGISVLYAVFISRLVARFGKTKVHGLGLFIGGVSLISILFISSPYSLLLCMMGLGVAWGSVLSIPYAILADSLPSHRMGVYMGIFNFFITFPQIICGLLGGMLIKFVFNNQPIYGIVLGGFFMLIASFCAWRIKESASL